MSNFLLLFSLPFSPPFSPFPFLPFWPALCFSTCPSSPLLGRHRFGLVGGHRRRRGRGPSGLPSPPAPASPAPSIGAPPGCRSSGLEGAQPSVPPGSVSVCRAGIGQVPGSWKARLPAELVGPPQSLLPCFLGWQGTYSSLLRALPLNLPFSTTSSPFLTLTSG